MQEGKERIIEALATFSGRDGEPRGTSEQYILKALWLMMLSEFEASIKTKVENYIDEIKTQDIKNIHVCVLIRNFFGNKQEELTTNKIISFYKRDPNEINYRNFTQDRKAKYKTQAIEKLFNHLGIFFSGEELSNLALLDGIASTRDSIAHGDIGVQITRRELESQLSNLDDIMQLLSSKLLIL